MSEGWIPHDGGEMPCDGEVLVDVILRSNYVYCGCQANDLAWDQLYDGTDIIFWRPHKNADGQAGQDTNPAPSQEGHAAGPACSAPEGEYVPVRSWQHEETGRVCETSDSPGKRWHKIPAAPDEALIEEIANDALKVLTANGGYLHTYEAAKWAIREYIRRSAGKEKT